MFLDLTGDQRGRPDGGKMVSASTAPASSPSAATPGRRGLLLRVNLWLIGVIVDVVVALRCGDKMRQEKREGQSSARRSAVGRRSAFPLQVAALT